MNILAELHLIFGKHFLRASRIKFSVLAYLLIYHLFKHFARAQPKSVVLIKKISVRTLKIAEFDQNLGLVRPEFLVF